MLYENYRWATEAEIDAVVNGTVESKLPHPDAKWVRSGKWLAYERNGKITIVPYLFESVS